MASAVRLGVWLEEFRGLPRSVFTLAAARCINTFGFSIVMPYLAYRLTTQGNALSLVGAIYTAAGLAGAAAQLLGGELADRVGRRRVMVWALALRVLVMLALGVSMLAKASLVPIGALVVVNAVLRSAFDPASQAQAAMHAGPRGRTAAFGLQRIGVNLGWALGPALGGLFAARSYGLMFFVAAGITGLAVAAAAAVPDAPARLLPVDGREAAPISARFRVADLLDTPHPRAFAAFLGVTLVMSIVTTQLFSTMPVFAMTRLHVSEARFGLLFTVNGVLVVLLQGPFVRLIDRLGIRRALVAGPVAYAAGYFSFAFAHGLSHLALSVAMVTAGELLTEPAEMVAAVALGAADRPGRAMGVFGMISALGNSLGPGVGGLVYDHTPGRPRLLWGAVALLSLFGAAGYAGLGRMRGLPAELLAAPPR
jgi:MFS family permease